MPEWKIEDYRDRNGHSSLREFLDALKDRAREKRQRH
jgi:hypothetical protein